MSRVPDLSEVEQEVVLHYGEGRSREAIAAELGVSVRTVDWHLLRARRKLARAAALHEQLAAAEPPDGADGSGPRFAPQRKEER
jgi:DNA-binding NarL/FixJ family response regulator